ncbi:hypothetical protein JQR85_13740 [Stutzerimonas urumqiensis]|uniref:hypothetical protein n=1 Tax=Stutzerimonas urumqiensis TaxID=638269 RepID=UPI003DA63F70
MNDRVKELEGLLRETERYISDETTTPAMLSRLAVRINAALSQQAEPECSCPSGDGSPRWPCRAHPQAEPKCSTCNDVGIIGHSMICPECADSWEPPVEPAPAQDERVSTSDVREALKFYEKATGRFVVPKGVSEHQDQFVQGWLAKAEHPRPAQTEQQPSASQQILDLILEECRYWQGRDEARRGGFACLYAQAKEIVDNAAPIAKAEQQPVAMVDANDEGMWADILPDVSVKVGQMLYAAPIAQTEQRPDIKLGDPHAQIVTAGGKRSDQDYVVVRRSLLEAIAACEWRGEMAASSGNELRAVMAGRITYDLIATPIAQTAPQPEQSGLVKALEYYANGDHLLLADPDAWDTCSGEPLNFLHDEAGTASVEDGSIAKVALKAYRAALAAQGGAGDE